jgi:3-hydroxyisobutyrate dehydrogenase-like beta-hydroxyacid dehydrogenase
MPPQTPVGLIGVGLMGEVCATRLVAAGFGVIGFDVDAARMQGLVQIGGRAGSAAEIARQCDPIVIAVLD